jgi:hypothetical protein
MHELCCDIEGLYYESSKIIACFTDIFELLLEKNVDIHIANHVSQLHIL